MRFAVLRLILIVFLAAGWWSSTHAQALTERPSDGLLTTPALQAIVDLQVERDGPALIDMLADSSAAVRARAAFALASVQDSMAVPALLGLLQDASASVRADVAFALGQATGRVPSDPLIDALLQEPDSTVQHLLIEALAKQGDQASLVRLVTLDLDEALRPAVALAVGRYALRAVHASSAIAFLLDALRDEDPATRLHAAYYFGRSRETTPWLPDADSVRAIFDDLALDDEAAMHLVTGLSRLDDLQDTPRLMHWLAHAEDWRTRLHAVRALASRTDVQGVRGALYDRLVDPSIHVAETAAQALNDGKPWADKDIELISQWVQYNAYAWRITTPLLEGLAQQGETTMVLNELSRRRSAPPLLAYGDALSALAYLPRADALDLLVEAAHHQNSYVAGRALQTLNQRWSTDRAGADVHDVYFDVFAYGLQRVDRAALFTIAPTLADSLFQPIGATEVLIDVYNTLEAPDVTEARVAMLDALGATGDTTAIPVLQAALSDPKPAIARAASVALTTLTGQPVEVPQVEVPPERTIDWDALRAMGRHPRLQLDTEKGTILLTLDAEQAPLTTQTIAHFARSGAYDGVPFHRVVPNFVIQSGDFTRGDGYGGPGFAIRSEFTRIPYTRGTLGMASAGKDTEGSQFFITHSMQPHLDGRYTAFGTVDEGLDVVDVIARYDRVLKAYILPDTGAE